MYNTNVLLYLHTYQSKSSTQAEAGAGMTDGARPVQAGAAPETDDATPTISELPAAAIDNILQWVPLDRRLTVCSRVCQTWAAAVARSPSSLRLRLWPGPNAAHRLPVIRRCLTDSAQQVTSLYIESLDTQLSGTIGTLQLPCSRLTRLQELTLGHIDIRLPACDPMAAAGRTAVHAAASSSNRPHSTAISTALSPLPALQRLSLKKCTLHTAADLLHLVSSPALSSLQLQENQVRQVHAEKGRHPGAAGQPGVLAVPAIPQWWSCLRYKRQLQELRLVDCGLDPGPMSSATSLHILSLSRCQFLPGAQYGMRALLSSMRGFTQLQHVDLMLLPPGSVQGLAPELFAALTASQQLIHLRLTTIFEQPLPRGAVQHMFPAGRCMGELRQLNISFEHLDKNDYTDPDFDWCMYGEDLCSIAHACPRLQDLKLGRVVQPGASFSALPLLPPSLTSLTVWGPAFGDAAAAAVAQLTQLQSFEWDDAPDLSDLGFMHLTALTRLTKLSANSWYRKGLSLSNALFLGGTEPRRKVVNLTGRPSKPVWQQVQAMCSTSPACDEELRRRREAREAARKQQAFKA